MRKKNLLKVTLLNLLCITAIAQTPQNLTIEEKTVFNQHETEVRTSAKITSGEYMAELMTKYFIVGEQLSKIKQIIEDRELKMAIYNYIYPENDKVRFEKKQNILIEYVDPLTKELLLAGAYVSTDNYFMILKKKEYLNLSQTQINSIIENAIELNRKLIRSPRMDVWAFELNSFNIILETNQMDKFLTMKNDGRALRDVRNAWKTLVANNMSNDLDSVKVSHQLYNHYLNIYKATDLYSENDSLKLAAIKSIHNVAPVPIARLKSLKKSDLTKQSYRGTYAW